MLLSSLVEGPQTYEKLSLGKQIEKEIGFFVLKVAKVQLFHSSWFQMLKQQNLTNSKLGNASIRKQQWSGILITV